MYGAGTTKNARAAQIPTHLFLKNIFSFEKPKKVTIKYMN